MRAFRQVPEKRRKRLKRRCGCHLGPGSFICPSECRSVGARGVCFDLHGKSTNESGKKLEPVLAAANTLAKYALAHAIDRLKVYG